MNIIVFTSIYPFNGTKSGMTPVVKYFCEDWVRMGHRVVVISSTTKFPLLLYYLPNSINKKIENKVGFNVPNKLSRKKIRLIENGVEIFQLPNSKLLPGKIIAESQIESNINEIESFLKLKDFKPNIAVGHWINPQIQYLSYFKKKYNIPTSLIIHEKPNKNELQLLRKYLPFIDNIGYRSEKLIPSITSQLNVSDLTQFMCYSGVKDYFNISDQLYQVKPIESTNIKVCFVGNMISRKYPEIILQALNKIPSIKFEIHYVGDGEMIQTIKKIKPNNNISVFFHGRKQRKEVYEVLKDANFFVMLSKNETFGLVYLEAMLNRIIPIASFNEGFDGIIKDGYNGFLGHAGNVKDLVSIFTKIQTMPKETLYQIQRNAYATALEMTDEKMAETYLYNIIHSKV